MHNVMLKLLAGAMIFVAGVFSTMFGEIESKTENRSRIRLVSLVDDGDTVSESKQVQIDLPKFQSSEKPTLGNYVPKKVEAAEPPPIDAEIAAIEKRVASLESKVNSTASYATSAAYSSPGSGSVGGGGSNGTVSYSSYQTSPTDCNVYSYQSGGSTGSYTARYQSTPVVSYQPVRTVARAATTTVQTVTRPVVNGLRFFSPSDRCYVDANGNRVCP